MKIANIVYEKDLVNHTKVEYVNYYNKSIEYNCLDKSLPTLYVGWTFMKVSNPNNELIQNADILKKKIISNELYWEFDFDESRNSHVKGVDNFVLAVPKLYFQPKYTYVNLDPVFFQIVDIDELLTVLPKEIDAVYNLKNEMLYLLKNDVNGNKIIGINLKMYEFFKFSVELIISSIKIRSTQLIDDIDGLLYQNYYKTFPNFPHLKRYMIAFLTK